MAATKCAIKQPGGRLTSAPLPPPAPMSAAGTKRHGGVPEPPPAKQARNEEASQSKRQEKLRAVDAMEKTLGEQARTSKPEQVLAWIDGQFKDSVTRPAISGLMSRVCRNCISGGRGIQKQSRLQCEQSGNAPSEPCSICAKAGQISYHWRSQCQWKGSWTLGEVVTDG